VILAYLANTIAYPVEKRAICQAIVNMVANLASIYGSYLWPTASAPRYALGFGVTCAFCFTCACSALMMGWMDAKFPYHPGFPAKDEASKSEVASNKGEAV